MKKAVILTADLFEDMEVLYPLVDGNLITSRYPADLPAFMREVMKLVDAL